MLVFGLLCLTAFSLLAEGQSGRRFQYANRARPSRHYSAAQQAQQQQQQPRARPPYQPGGNPPGGQEEEEPPMESWRDLLRRNNVTSVDDFIHLLVTPEGRQVRDDDIFSPYVNEEGKRMITGGGIMATSDECSPRNMSVRLPLNYSDDQVAYYPECTMVQRCGGCTPTPLLSCEPRYKEKIVLKVLRARYIYPGALSMRWEGFTSVEVERHLTCRAVCNLRPSDCNPGQSFNSYQCKCQCRRVERCRNEKVWDGDHCFCRCPNEGPCCAEEGEEDDRTCTSYFDHDFCDCTLKTSIGFPVNASQQEIDDWYASRRSQNLPTLPTQPTTPPPETTTEDCLLRPCPRNFMRVHNNRGGCVCVYRMAGGRRRPRRRG